MKIQTGNKIRFRAILWGFITALLVSACSGGGGGSGFKVDGPPVSGKFNPTASQLPKYSFNATSGTPYTVSLVSTEGNADLIVATGNLNVDPYATWIDYSWTSTSNLDQVSFIADYDGSVFIHPLTFDTTLVKYTVQVTSNHLTVDGDTKSSAAFNDSLYYSFDAQAGSTYQVRLKPTQGNVNIGAVSPNVDMSASVGSSSNTGTALDSVYVTAAATQRYYIRVATTSVDSNFDINVVTVPNDPELSVVVDSAISDGTDVTVNYTVTNQGALAYSGNVQVDVWSNPASVPAVGATGNDSVTHTGVVIAGLGGTMSGSSTIPDTSNSGTAYAVVDTINAIAESDENNNVSAGVYWEKPYSVPVSIGFETGIPSKFIMSGSADWTLDSVNGGSGSLTSLNSGSITHSQSSCFAFSAAHSQSVQISFDRKVSSEGGFDYLRFYIDGVQQASWSGTVAWGNVAYTTGAGVHEYKWCYTKDNIVSSGTDEAWVDNISLVQMPPDLSVAINSVSSNGVDVTINYTVTNNSSVAVGPFAVDLWADSVSAPLVGATGQASSNHTGLAASASSAGSVVIPSAAASGTAYAIVDTTDAVLETNETNNVSAGQAWTITAADLTVAIIGVSSDGTNVTVNYTVTNNGNAAAGSFDVDVWSNAASAPAVGDAGEIAETHASLAAGASINSSVVIANAAASGTAYAVADSADTVLEINEADNVSAGMAWETPPTAPVAYNFEDNLVPATFVMSGTTGWVTDNTNGATASTTSFRAGTIGASQQTCAAITVLGSSSVSFDYNVSSEGSFDFLRFYIDGVQQASWSGLVAWTNANYAVTTGNHEYKWCYTKDGSVNSNADTAWVDNITIN